MSKLCEVCQKGSDEKQLITCKTCGKIFHTYCLMGCTCCHKKAPGCVKGVMPIGDFYCKFCVDHFPPVDEIKSELYGWGSNGSGQLGLGHTELVLKPTLVKEAQSVSVVEMTGGLHFSVLLTADDMVYTAGDGNNGKLGHTDIIHETLTHFRSIAGLQPAKRVKSDGTMSHVSCGEEYTYCITTKNGVYVWGNGQYGVFGNQKENDIKKPVKPGCYKECERKIAKISCGYNHVLLLSTFDELMTIGHNDCGQLGSGDFTDQWVPHFLNVKAKDVPHCMLTPNTEVSESVSFSDIYAGNNFSIVKEESHCYGMGLSTSGQLTFLPEVTAKTEQSSFITPQLKYFQLTPLPSLDSISIKTVICGSNHVMILDNTSHVYTYGTNTNGELGLGHTNPLNTPVLIESLKAIVPSQICCGSNHTLLLTSEGEVYSWGKNDEGELGLDNKENQTVPVKIEALHNIFVIGCGFRHSFALVNPRTLKRKREDETDDQTVKKSK